MAKDRPWLNYDEAKNVTTSSMCIKLTNRNLTYMTNNSSPKSSNPFLNGCSNFKTSALNDQDENAYCEGFLYEDVNLKLVAEYAREE